MRRAAALIVGGGPAGAAAAITLAHAGAPHLLVERTRETGDALCGGFLSWRSLETLERLGIPADALGGARIDRVRIVASGRVREAVLPSPALAVSRHRLDGLLLVAAERAGAHIERGVAVRSVEGNRAVIDGAAQESAALFLATGKHDVRGAARAEPEIDPTLGLRVRLPGTPGLRRLVGSAVELHLVGRGYVGVALQEDGSANLCMAIRRSRLREADSPAALLTALGAEAPRLGERLAYGAADAPIDAVANVPYGWRAAATNAGLFRLGDQAGVIPSLAGEGMGIALASGIAAAQAYLRGGAAAAPTWQAAFARRLTRPLAIAGLVRRAAERPMLHPFAAAMPASAVALLAQLTRIEP